MLENKNDFPLKICWIFYFFFPQNFNKTKPTFIHTFVYILKAFNGKKTLTSPDLVSKLFSKCRNFISKKNEKKSLKKSHLGIKIKTKIEKKNSKIKKFNLNEAETKTGCNVCRPVP